MRTVNLTLCVNGASGKRFLPVVMSANGRVKPEYAIIDGVETKFPGCTYYLDWRENGKRVRKAVGKNAMTATIQKARKETELDAIDKGLIVAEEPADDGKPKTLDAGITFYLEEIRATKKKKTYANYSLGLQYFKESCKKKYLKDVDRRDMIFYASFLRDEKHLKPRTVWNHFNYVIGFLKALGYRNIVRANDWPRYVEPEVEAYTPEEIKTFFAACTPKEKTLFEFFLMTGMRELEVVYSMGRDLHPESGTVVVTPKPEYHWTPKAYKGREIPIPSTLMATLQGLQIGQDELLFHTSSGKPRNDFLDRCKAIAKRAKLNPEDWWLHKFRATFATWHLQAGVDVRTVQMWLGHSDLASTLRYLKPARGAGVQEKVNNTFATLKDAA